MPTVSVVIPFHNGICWLVEAVQSVFDQTFADFEIILVDDGSTENIDSIKNIEDRRIRYFKQENKGSSAARNYGIDLAKGRYVAFLDSDDLFLPDKLEKQVAFMEGNPNVLLSHTSYQRITAEGDFLEEIPSGNFGGSVYPEIISNCPIATPTVMTRREILGNELRFEESISIGEDIILWSRIAKISKILGLHESLTKVRIHGNNAALDPKKVLRGNINIINYAMIYDNKFTFIFRQKHISSTYFYIATIYLKKQERIKAIMFIIMGILAWPLNIRRLLRKITR